MTPTNRHKLTHSDEWLWCSVVETCTPRRPVCVMSRDLQCRILVKYWTAQPQHEIYCSLSRLSYVINHDHKPKLHASAVSWVIRYCTQNTESTQRTCFQLNWAASNYRIVPISLDCDNSQPRVCTQARVYVAQSEPGVWIRDQIQWMQYLLLLLLFTTNQ